MKRHIVEVRAEGDHWGWSLIAGDEELDCGVAATEDEAFVEAHEAALLTRPDLMVRLRLVGETASDAEAEEQRRLRAQVEPIIGSVHDGTLQGENSSQQMRELLLEKYERSQRGD